VPPRPVAPVRNDSEVARGELVGPGPGVSEPELLGAPKITYPAIARGQRVSGKVVVLVLVDESGSVAEARLQQTIPNKSGVNEAVLEGVRRARFRPASKYGVPVKMWRTVIVDVKP
jgi:TonB family protein